jgi:hypothetical protein
MTAHLWKLGAAAVVAMSSVTAAAQNSHAVSVGANYTYVRTNLVPGCSCFSLNGGGVQAQVEFTSHWAMIGDVTLTHKGGITSDNYALTQLTYTGGIRVRPFSARARFRPFAEAMLGGASTFGTLSPSRDGVGGGSNAFAFEPGGGLEIRIGSRLSMVPIEADYLLTTFSNAANNRQNDVRLSAGFAIRLSR